MSNVCELHVMVNVQYCNAVVVNGGSKCAKGRDHCLPVKAETLNKHY